MAFRMRAALRLAAHAAGTQRHRSVLFCGSRAAGGVRGLQPPRFRAVFAARSPSSARLLGARGLCVCSSTIENDASAASLVEAAAPPPEGVPAVAVAEASSAKPSPFMALGLHEKIASRMHSLGAERPTAVQAAAVPVILSGVNTAVQARTGSGKTLAYLLPALEVCLREERGALLNGEKRKSDAILAIVVAPSQELAIQIVRETERILGDAARQYVQQCIGGANINRQVEGLRKNKPMVVVGSPGRLAELSEMGQLRSHGTKMLIIDEADELLDPIFRRSLSRLGEHAGRGVPGGRQTILVSATLSQKVLDGYSPWCCKEPRSVAVTGPTFPEPQLEPPPPTDGVALAEGGPAGVSNLPDMPENLTHAFVLVDDSRHRVDALRRSIHALEAQRALVFLNFARRLDDTCSKLAARGMQVGALHGELTKGQRNTVLTAFRQGKLRALLVTDLAARGLDVPECDAVFNLELPTDGTHYAHRAGRTGRLGRPGIVVSLVEQREAFVISKFEKALKVTISRVSTEGGEMRVLEKRPPAPRKPRAPKAPETAGGGEGDAGAATASAASGESATRKEAPEKAKEPGPFDARGGWGSMGRGGRSSSRDDDDGGGSGGREGAGARGGGRRGASGATPSSWPGKRSNEM